MASSASGWMKHPRNPVLGGDLGTCFDINVLRTAAGFRMYFSWRPRAAIACVESRDGVHWSEPTIVLPARPGSGWEEDVNRPGVLEHDGRFHMWYTGQNKTRSFIGYATSADGLHWERRSAEPVLSPEEPWEGTSVMCPHVLWDEESKLYRMWYSAGEQYEPDVIGYATSPDGLRWTRRPGGPVFTACPDAPWEACKVAGGQVIRMDGWHVMFYIGFANVHRAAIGLARSRDGLTGWERHPLNPILEPTPGGWDAEACYKPYALPDGERWLLWYNGRSGTFEQIGLATLPSATLGFE